MALMTELAAGRRHSGLYYLVLADQAEAVIAQLKEEEAERLLSQGLYLVLHYLAAKGKALVTALAAVVGSAAWEAVTHLEELEAVLLLAQAEEPALLLIQEEAVEELDLMARKALAELAARAAILIVTSLVPHLLMPMLWVH